jgi:hypothetical protein
MIHMSCTRQELSATYLLYRRRWLFVLPQRSLGNSLSDYGDIDEIFDHDDQTALIWSLPQYHALRAETGKLPCACSLKLIDHVFSIFARSHISQSAER